MRQLKVEEEVALRGEAAPTIAIQSLVDPRRWRCRGLHARWRPVAQGGGQRWREATGGSYGAGPL